MTSQTLLLLRKMLVPGVRFRWLNTSFYHVKSVDWDKMQVVCHEKLAWGANYIAAISGIQTVVAGTENWINRMIAALKPGVNIVWKNNIAYTVTSVDAEKEIVYAVKRYVVRLPGEERVIYHLPICGVRKIEKQFVKHVAPPPPKVVVQARALPAIRRRPVAVAPPAKPLPAPRRRPPISV